MIAAAEGVFGWLDSARRGRLSASSAAMGPLCFLHVPKCGGQSVERALEAALPDGAVAPRGADLGGSRIVSDLDSFDDADEWVRALIAITDEDVESLRTHRVVAGHYMLATFLRISRPARIATVLREPRARLLSLYLFFRTPQMREVWADYCGTMLAGASRALEQFLHDPRLARATDNQVCRMVLDGDRRVPDDGFIAEHDAERIAASALEQLDRLGFVGILESGDALWRDLSDMFGVPLVPRRVNESSTPVASVGAAPIPPYDSAAVFDGLERRTAADRIVYETLVARTCGGLDEARRRADTALAKQLDRFHQVGARSTAGPPRAPLATAYRKEGR